MALLRMLATHKCALGSIPQQKPTLLNSNQIWKQGTRTLSAVGCCIENSYLFIYLFIY